LQQVRLALVLQAALCSIITSHRPVPGARAGSSDVRVGQDPNSHSTPPVQLTNSRLTHGPQACPGTRRHLVAAHSTKHAFSPCCCCWHMTQSLANNACMRNIPSPSPANEAEQQREFWQKAKCFTQCSGSAVPAVPRGGQQWFGNSSSNNVMAAKCNASCCWCLNGWPPHSGFACWVSRAHALSFKHGVSHHTLCTPLALGLEQCILSTSYCFSSHHTHTRLSPHAD
jgi:hypothetical protein